MQKAARTHGGPTGCSSSSLVATLTRCGFAIGFGEPLRASVVFRRVNLSHGRCRRGFKSCMEAATCFLEAGLCYIEHQEDNSVTAESRHGRALRAHGVRAESPILSVDDRRQGPLAEKAQPGNGITTVSAQNCTNGSMAGLPAFPMHRMFAHLYIGDTALAASAQTG